MSSETPTIASDNLSVAWARAFLHITARGVQEITPLVVTVEHRSVNGIAEQDGIRAALDDCIGRLKSKYGKLQQCSTVANTIFPDSLWNSKDEDGAARLFERFDRAWPRIKRCPQNHRGSYFRRLTAFRGRENDDTVNQLKHIINTYRKGNHRRSALQASIFDPALDHKDCRQLGFPCLHQVAFNPDGKAGLAVTAFYATQYLFDRAYGNYLGLCRLGRFMASQMELTLTRLTCITSVAELGTPNKSEVQPLGLQLKRLLAKDERMSS